MIWPQLVIDVDELGSTDGSDEEDVRTHFGSSVRNTPRYFHIAVVIRHYCSRPSIMSEPPLLKEDVRQLEHILSKIHEYCSQQPDANCRLYFVLSMAKEAALDLLVARERARDKHYEIARQQRADLFVARSVADLDVLYKQYEEHRHRLVGELLISIMNNINIDMAMRHRLVDELLLLPAGASVGPSTAGRNSLRLLGVRSL